MTNNHKLPGTDTSIILNGRKIQYDLLRSKRKTMEVRVSRNNKVEVRVPLRSKDQHIEKFISERKEWLLKIFEKNRECIFIDAPGKFENEEELYFLGNKYRLKILKDIRNHVEIDRDNIIVNTTSPENQARIKNILSIWYKSKIEDIFKERLDECLKITKKIGIDKAGKITYRKMDKRWGTCTPGNNIILNSNLIFLSMEYIDYVILHELCHFLEKNHGKHYYHLLEQVYPDHRLIKKKLDNHLIESFL